MFAYGLVDSYGAFFESIVHLAIHEKSTVRRVASEKIDSLLRERPDASDLLVCGFVTVKKLLFVLPVC